MPSLPSRSETLEIAGKKTRKSRYQTFLVLSSFTGFFYFIPKILPRIVGIRDGDFDDRDVGTGAASRSDADTREAGQRMLNKEKM